MKMRAEVDCAAMKSLLKQVYVVYSSQLKSLEDEIENLRKNLHEAENKLKNCSSECKRCIELEEAFKSCKSALHEQSKWIENLGQKITNSNTAEKEANVSKILNESDVNSNEQSGVSQYSTKTHLLKNIISLNPVECQESLGLLCPPVHKKINSDYSSLVVDSLVLAPDTVDVTNDIQEKNRTTLGVTTSITAPNIMCSNVTKQPINSNVNNNCRKSTRKVLGKKRLSGNFSELTTDRHIEEKEIKTTGVNKKLKTSDIHIDSAAQTLLTKQTTNDASNHKNKSPIDVSVNNKNVDKTSPLNNKMQDSKNNLTINNRSNKDDIVVSPSLIPVNENTNTPEDINDFIIAPVCKKTVSEEGSWTSCDKRKLNKKVLNIKSLKTTSKFKMQLDGLPPNFKKPVYRQTKLSKSVFKTKSLNAESTEDKSNKSKDTLETSGKYKAVDFDATFIPDNYEYEVISSGKSNISIDCREKNIADESDEENSPELIIEQPALIRKSSIRAENSADDVTIKNEIIYEIGNSFDRLPKKEEPKYKYKEETVRKKTERKQLTGFDCNECEKYYTELGLSDEEKQKRMNKCSRHRAKFAPPPTPEHFWELDFPDTQECKARGYLNETQKGTLKSHRKRPL